MRLELASGSVDLQTGLLKAPDGGRVQLSAQECALLAYLSERARSDVPREELHVKVLGYSPRVISRAVDDSVRRLRVKIEPTPARPLHIVSVPGVGYRFVPISQSRRSFQLDARTVDLDRLEVLKGEQVTPLSSIEGRLLELLLAAKGRPVPIDDLLREVWNIRDLSRSKLVGKAVYRLRAKLEDHPKQPQHLTTIRGRGLALRVPAPLGAQDPIPEPTAVGWLCEPPLVQVVGRAQEQAQVDELLQTEGVVVTLVGAGGMGKTTLARSVGALWPGPASFVDLSGVITEEQLHEAVATAHGVDLASVDGLDPIAHALAHAGNVLVVLDNADGCIAPLNSLFERLARFAPEARFLVTSRVPLRHPRERQLRLEGLTAEAARVLFCQRAERAGVRGLVDERVDALTSSLHYMPLAIEIAAARTPLLGIDGILERLDEPLRLLRSPSHKLPRHASLHHVLQVSWAPLSPSARRALAACALFKGTFSVQRAEQVIDTPDALDQLQELIDRMLIARRPDGRLATMLAVSEFTLQALDPDDQPWLEDARRRLVRAYASESADLEEYNAEPGPSRYPSLVPEVDEAGHALTLAVERGWRDDAARILLWALPVLARLRLVRRAAQWIERLGDPAGVTPEVERPLRWRITKVYFSTGLRQRAFEQAEALHAAWPGTTTHALMLSHRVGVGASTPGHKVDLEQAYAIMQSNRPGIERLAVYWSLTNLYADPSARLDWSASWIRLARSSTNRWDLTDARNRYAQLLARCGRPDEAVAPVQSILACYQEAGITAPTFYPVLMASIRLRQGRLDEAEAFGLRGHSQASENGALASVVWSAGVLGQIYGIRGDLERCAEWFGRAMASSEHLGIDRDVALHQSNLGETWRRQGKTTEARRALTQAASTLERLGEQGMMATPLRSRGRLELDSGHLELAHELLKRARSVEYQGSPSRWLTQAVFAEVLARMGDPSALPLAREATEQSADIGRTENMVNGLYHHAQAARALGQAEEAQEMLERAAALIQELELDERAEIYVKVAALRAQ